MCGITGYYFKSIPFSEIQFEEMTDCLSHRGPDASGIFQHKNWGLGHRRLSILDLSTGANQPMTSHCGRYVMVFNGEIYNFREIAKELDLSLKTTSDSEVILEAFVKLGPAFVDKMNGMFALAIVDKTTDKLYLFRDRIGIKPLYYYWDGTNLAFASELKALEYLQPNLGKFSVDFQSIYSYLNLGFISQPRSIYSAIKKLPSGHMLTFDPYQGPEVKEYWSLLDSFTETTLKDPVEVKKLIKEKLIESVEKRLISDVKVGTFLSGGIDSSLISAIVSKPLGRKIDTFSIGFKESEFDESPYAQSIADYLGSNHHQFVVTEKDALEYLPHFFEAYDEPFSDSSAIPTMLVSKLAREDVTVVLSGDGADELFFGYDRIIRSKFYAWNGWKLFKGPLASLFKHIPDHRFKKVSNLFQDHKEGYFHTHLMSQEASQFSVSEFPKLLQKSLVDTDYFFKETTPSNRDISVRERHALFEMNFFLIDDILTKVDRASMFHGLEARVPFLDHEFVSLAMNIDPGLKFSNGVTKAILKDLLYEWVPKSYFDRPKQGFSIPLNNWLKKDLTPLIDTYLSESSISNTGIFSVEYVNMMKHNFLNGGKAYNHFGQRIWQLIVLQKWMIDREQSLLPEASLLV